MKRIALLFTLLLSVPLLCVPARAQQLLVTASLPSYAGALTASQIESLILFIQTLK